MNRLTFNSARLVAALLVLQPLSSVAQQKKVLTPAEVAQAQRDTAARLAAAKKKAAARAAGQPAPTAGVPTAGGAVSVSVTNNSQVTFRAVVNGQDGTPVVVGEIPPSAQAGGPTQLTSFPGQEWGFANPEGQIVATYVATAAAQQRYNLGAPGAAPPPAPPRAPAPAANATASILQGPAVKLLIRNLSGVPVRAIRSLPDGSLKDFGEIPPTVGNNPPSDWSTRPGVKWIFTANGQAIYEYTVSQGATQNVTIPDPATRAAATQRAAAQQASTQQAAAQKLQRRQAFLARLNTARDQAGVAPLAWSPELEASSVPHAGVSDTVGGWAFHRNYFEGGPQSPLDVLNWWLSPEMWNLGKFLLNENLQFIGYAENARGIYVDVGPR